MRPIMLKGHERSLTQVKFNREGDLLFSVAKDKTASVWYSFNGERLGTFEGHIGTIWSIDVDQQTQLVVTLSADFSVKLWKAQTGECVKTWSTETPARWVQFSPDDSKLLVVTDQVMGKIGTISIFDINRTDVTLQSDTPSLVINTQEGSDKVTCAGYSYLGKFILAGHSNGYVSKFDAQSGDLIKTVKVHDLTVTDIQFSDDKTYFITASKDKTAHVLDVENLDILKFFEADAPMNSACITPVKNFVILGGGQDAKDVTTTGSKQGKFEARFYHKIFEDEIGRVKGHFGPLNYVAVHPKGTMYASGGEDGFIRLHHFDKSYFDFKYDVERTAEVTGSVSHVLPESTTA